MDGVHGVEPGRADRDEAALTLEDGALAARLAGDDDACVTVVKSQAVVVLRHEQRVGVRLFSSAWKAGLLLTTARVLAATRPTRRVLGLCHRSRLRPAP